MKNAWTAAGERFLSRAAHVLEHHPRHVTIALAVLMLGGAGAAFGVASLDPQPDPVMVRHIVEEVTPLPIDPQLRQLDAAPFHLYRTDATRASDTVEALLARLGVHDEAAADALRRDATFRAQLLGRAGRTVTVDAGDDGSLQKLTARWIASNDGTFRRLVVQRAADGTFASRVETAPLVASVRSASATVHTSLFAAADDAHIPDGVVGQVVEIFAPDIDFRSELRTGDRFAVVYESLEADGEPMRVGRVLSAEFVNAGHAHQAIWFQEPGSKGAYYSPDGHSLATSYLASPVEFTRVSSGFAMRFHPVLHEWKAHLGIDYAAPIGAPVRVVGDGSVEFAGVQNGFGNVVIVRHNGTEETVYAHLSRIDVRTGQRVAQGDHLGAVGQTGWATGPHLHFEFRVNGVHQNPAYAIARRANIAPLTAAVRPDFDRLARSMQAQLAAAASTLEVASAE